MAEQSGSGRYPKPPATQSWEGSDPAGANDPESGAMGSPFATGAEGGDWNAGANVPHPVAGSNFTGGPSGEGSFEQGEMPGTDINYFSFKG